MLDQLDWKMLAAFTILLSFHGSIFLKLAKNTFITKIEHDVLSKKLDSRLFKKDGMPIYISQDGCDRRQLEHDRRQTAQDNKTCLAIKELQKEVKELRDIVLRNFPGAT